MPNHYTVTTVDNPFNPFTNFDKWFMFDSTNGYNTSGKLAHLMENMPEDLTEAEEMLYTEHIVDRFMAIDVLGIYKKVCIDDPDEVYKTSPSPIDVRTEKTNTEN